MNFQEYISEKLQIQNEICALLSNDITAENMDLDNLIQYLNCQKIHEDENEFKSFFYLLSNICCNYHRSPDFSNKIEKILFLIYDDIKKYYTSSELFSILNETLSKTILYFLIKNQICQINLFISNYMINEFEEYYLIYFFNELKPFLNIEKIEEIETNYKDEELYSEKFNVKCKNGENEFEICKMIRNDSIIDFISYINRTNYSLDSIIKKSIYETNPFLIENKPSLIEYSAFFGSIQIFNYLRMNNVKLTPSLWIYAIHGNNPEIIHILEENHIEPEDKIYEKCVKEAIKCFHDEIANYLIQEKNISMDVVNSFGLCYHNYIFIPNNFTGNKTFFDLCRYGHSFFVEKILQSQKNIDVNFKIKTDVRESYGLFSPLIISVINNHINVANILLKRPEIDINDDKFQIQFENFQYIGNALYEAILYNNTRITKLLLEHRNIDINKRYYEKFVMSDNCVQMIESFPLFIAIGFQYVDIVKILLSSPNINVNMLYLNYDGIVEQNQCEKSNLHEKLTGLYKAVTLSNIEIIKLLLSYPNIDVNTKSYLKIQNNYYKETSLYCSIREKKDEITKLFLSLHPNIDLNKKSHTLINEIETKESELNLAIKNGNTELVKQLLKISNIDVNIKSIVINKTHKTIDSSLSLALKSKNNEVIKLLLKFPNINVNFISKEITENEEKRETMLNLAVKNGDVEIVKLLLEFPNIDINKKSKISVKENDLSITNGKIKNTALHTAVLTGNYEIVSILLSHKKIDINQQGVNNNDSITKKWNALIMAISKNDIKMVELLLSYPTIDVNSKYNLENSNFLRIEKSALYLSIEKGYDTISKLLLERNEIDVNYPSSYKSETGSKINKTYILHNAFDKGNNQIIKQMLEKENIDVNVLSFFDQYYENNIFIKKEKTTLEYAINHGNIEIIQLLLSKEKLDFNIKSKESIYQDGTFVNNCKLPLEISINKKDSDIFQLLFNYYNDKCDPNEEYLNHLYSIATDDKIKCIISCSLHKL